MAPQKLCSDASVSPPWAASPTRTPSGAISRNAKQIIATLEAAGVEERTDPGLIKEKIRVDLQRFFRKRSGLRPLVLPVVMEI